METTILQQYAIRKTFISATSYRFNLERDAESRHAIQAAGPTGPHDHTSIRIGGFFYHGDNIQNIGATPPTYPGLGNFSEPFYRAGGDLRFRYHKLEIFGLGMVGHDDNHNVITDDRDRCANAC